MDVTNDQRGARGMSNSKIKTLYKGEFVLVDMVDETIELTVEDNVYSRSESLKLLEELRNACNVSRIADNMIGMKGIEDGLHDA
tara:strand:+ start:253 stop:504 length:252 start_codon:yes stop_codon:yes gene_type:complete